MPFVLVTRKPCSHSVIFSNVYHVSFDCGIILLGPLFWQYGMQLACRVWLSLLSPLLSPSLQSAMAEMSDDSNPQHSVIQSTAVPGLRAAPQCIQKASCHLLSHLRMVISLSRYAGKAKRQSKHCPITSIVNASFVSSSTVHGCLIHCLFLHFNGLPYGVGAYVVNQLLQSCSSHNVRAVMLKQTYHRLMLPRDMRHLTE